MNEVHFDSGVAEGQTAADPGDAAPPPTTIFEETIPFEEPVDAGYLLDEIVAISRRYIVMAPQAYDALALWIVFTWLISGFNTAPIAHVRSPEKRCGKTTLLRLLIKLCYRPLPASNVSTASLFHATSQFSPTLVLDEADTKLKANGEAIGILNCGHTRELGFVMRVESVGGVRQMVRYITYGPKAIASIGPLPDTIEDRSIPFLLQRKLLTDRTEDINQADPAVFQLLRRKLARLSQDVLPLMAAQQTPPVPGLNDRFQDNWRPLLAIAQVAGGAWLGKAVAAALALSGTPDTEDISLNVQLLADLKIVFRQRNAEQVTTREILQDLLAMEERPWRTVEKGRPLTPAQLAVRLRNFGIRVGTVRPDSNPGTPLKGYRQEHFLEIFRRYVG